MSLEYRIGDVFDRLADIPDGSIDLIVTSPPFLALRSYLPADHEHKHKEIGSEPTPAEFIDTLLALSAEWGRVLAPHGSICIELGDTYAGGNAVGTDHKTKSSRYPNGRGVDGDVIPNDKNGPGWPLAKSLTGIPTLYTWSLAYGRNLLTGQASPAGQWRIRNLIVWARPNPPVGALGDKFRPATSYITVACKGPKRYFDLDAVRAPGNSFDRPEGNPNGSKKRGPDITTDTRGLGDAERILQHNPAGAPPLDWHADDHPEDGDWLWKLSTQPYKGSHYATFPMTLPKRLIEAMCPQRVCVTCGKPSERVVSDQPLAEAQMALASHIEERRIASGYGRRDLADLFPHYKNTESIVAQFSNWERAKNVPSPVDWEILRDALGVSESFDPYVYGERKWTESLVDYIGKDGRKLGDDEKDSSGYRRGGFGSLPDGNNVHASRVAPTGWTDCGHDTWRVGVTLDPFAGSGTTLEAAQAVGRHAIGIDIDHRNAELAQQRVGMFLEVIS